MRPIPAQSSTTTLPGPWHMLRRASSVTVSEMLPSPDEAWLPDAQGERYCCELRLAAVDGRRWQP
jgi:hypothetical protein